MKWAVKVRSEGDEAITLDEARGHLRIDAQGSPASHPDDGMIQGVCIPAARQYVENYLNLSVTRKSLTLYLDSFPSKKSIALPYSNLVEIEEVRYRDLNGEWQVWASENYDVDDASIPGRLILGYGLSWPETLLQPQSVQIDYSVGYQGSPYEIPKAIVSGMLLVIGDLYERREAVTDMRTYTNPTAERLLYPYRASIGI